MRFYLQHCSLTTIVWELVYQSASHQTEILFWRSTDLDPSLMGGLVQDEGFIAISKCLDSAPSEVPKKN